MTTLYGICRSSRCGKNIKLCVCCMQIIHDEQRFLSLHRHKAVHVFGNKQLTSHGTELNSRLDVTVTTRGRKRRLHTNDHLAREISGRAPQPLGMKVTIIYRCMFRSVWLQRTANGVMPQIETGLRTEGLLVIVKSVMSRLEFSSVQWLMYSYSRIQLYGTATTKTLCSS